MNRRRVLKILGKILMTEAMLMVPSPDSFTDIWRW